MRRRIWNQLIQVELLSTFHVELPGMIPNVDCDTLCPRNLNDTDFDETSITLPASRPDTDLTTMTYPIMKGRLCRISGKISTLASRLDLPDYSEVMGLDQQIVQVYTNVPPYFLQTSSLSVTDTPDLIIKRLSLSLLFNKSRCMLHRRYLTEPKGNGEFDFSKNVVIDTSMGILRLQALVHEAFLPGGPLCQDRWFLTALSMHDFLVAAMIVYLSLIQTLDKRSPRIWQSPLNDQQQYQINMLKQSHDIWSHTDNMSVEMKRASKLIAVLLRNLTGSAERSSTHESLITDASCSSESIDASAMALGKFSHSPGQHMN